MPIRIQEVVVDCAEPAALAAFWAAVMGTRWAARDESWATVDAGPLMLAFQRVPEPKSSPKNRLHLDVQVPDARAAVAQAVALGARVLSGPTLDDQGDGYVVLADPEDNEFCFVIDELSGWEAGQRALLAAADPVTATD
ncbi:VOC family protein [Cellulomonas soli]|uniref:VOC family protein n=1 Tax=Cellulomonas soli TaxID=931535 RepID=UPI003F86C929